MTDEITALQSEDDLKLVLATQYKKQINNYFGDDKQALRFLSGVISAVQRNPVLLECTPVSVINSFMTMAQLQLMPSDVSGEAYVIPYNDKKAGAKEAQFQLGYQGLVTLFYRAGVKDIVAEIVYSKDKFSYKNGRVEHEPDVFSKDRGTAKGAFVIVHTKSGGEISKVMSKDEIMHIGKRFSKSFNSKFTPWKESNDPQLWMWKKTVLKQASKLISKNEAITTAIAADNQDSVIQERINKSKEEDKSLTMGAALKTNDDQSKNKTEVTKSSKASN